MCMSCINRQITVRAFGVFGALGGFGVFGVFGFGFAAAETESEAEAEVEAEAEEIVSQNVIRVSSSSKEFDIGNLLKTIFLRISTVFQVQYYKPCAKSLCHIS